MSKQRSATERLNDLENALMSLYQTVDNIARDTLMIKRALELLGQKTSAIATAANIGDDTISELMVEAQYADLKQKVDDFISQGYLKAAEEITPDSFVVGRELHEGKPLVKRRQFTVASLNPEVVAKLVGKKVGDVVVIQEGKMDFEVSEVYAVVSPEAPQAEEAPASEESAPAQSEAASS